MRWLGHGKSGRLLASSGEWWFQKDIRYGCGTMKNYICKYTYICPHIYIYICINVCRCTWMYRYVHIFIHVRICITYTYIHIGTCIVDGSLQLGRLPLCGPSWANLILERTEYQDPQLAGGLPLNPSQGAPSRVLIKRDLQGFLLSTSLPQPRVTNSMLQVESNKKESRAISIASDIGSYRGLKLWPPTKVLMMPELGAGGYTMNRTPRGPWN